MSRSWPTATALRHAAGVVLVLATVAASGCGPGQVCGEIPAIPVREVPPQFLGRSKENMQEISLSRLRQRPAKYYQLGPNDILGIYIETILGEQGEAPPVHFPEEGEKDPSIGFPIPVREDGTISLPLVPPIDVAGLTVEQVTELIRKAYTQDQKLLPEGESRIIVTLIKRRTYRVLVVRQEEGAKEGTTKRGTGFLLDLPAYENDLLHALNETGGLPGTDAMNEVLILHGDLGNGACYDEFIAQLKMQQGQMGMSNNLLPDPPNLRRIPLRFYPEEVPHFTEEDIILHTGDVVLIQSRDEEKFYSGGVLPGGDHLLPRDYDLDVLQAVAVAGGTVGSSGATLQASGMAGMGGNQGGGGGGLGRGPLPPTEAIIVRKLPNGGTLPIRVNLKEALTDNSQRVLMQPDDLLIVKYTCTEDVINTLLGMIQFNFLFNGFRGNGF